MKRKFLSFQCLYFLVFISIFGFAKENITPELGIVFNDTLILDIKSNALNGCLDSLACNYNIDAMIDNDSCQYWTCYEFLGAPLLDGKDFWRLILKTLFNLVIILLIARGIYYPITKNKDYLFTYLLISLTVFVLCVLLDDVKLQLGFALGLFAIFGIIRYRTDPIPIKEMTYLFIVIGISVINALANKKMSYAELLLTNSVIIFATYGMERLWLLKHESRKIITYEKIELITPDKHALLKDDLEKRTGLKITRFEIGKINFLNDTAQIFVHYYADEQDGDFKDEGLKSE